MARVTLDERLFGERRLHRLATLMGWSLRETVGTLAYLWHESQEAKRAGGTLTEIAEWSWIDDDATAQKFVSALQQVGYIHPDDDGDYIIHGNQQHIDNLHSYAVRGSMGGKSKAAKQQPSKTVAELEPSLAAANQLLSNSLPIHTCSAVQCSAEHSEQPVIVDAGKAAADPSPRLLVEVWNSECRGAMIKVAEMEPGTKRWNAAKARLSADPDLDAWRDRARRVAASPLVRGEVPGRDGQKPWRGNFDWFVRPDTRVKIAEGLYDGGRPPGTAAAIVPLAPIRTQPPATPEQLAQLRAARSKPEVADGG